MADGMHQTLGHPAKSFWTMVRNRWKQGFFLCVGLDSEYEKVARISHCAGVYEKVLEFNTRIIDATYSFAACYKINAAFYEALGDLGFLVVKATIDHIRKIAPDTPVIYDAKRGDIDNSNNGYVRSVFNLMKADAITVHPYMGEESLQRFLEREEKGVIVLCRTSNKGANEFQDLDCGGQPLFMHVAANVATRWNGRRNCGLVVGATYPKELAMVRGMVGDLPILVPGVGKQGGTVVEVIKNGLDSRGEGLIINLSRDVIFASEGENFAEAAGAKARQIHEEITRCREAVLAAKA